MSTEFHSMPPMNQLPETAREIARQATDVALETAHRATVAARDVTEAVKGAATDVADAVTDMYQSATLKAEDTLATSKAYVRQNPVLVVAGSLAFGAAIGCMLMMARRQGL